MALSKIIVWLEWENKNLFRLTEKGIGAAPDITIIESHENATIEQVWPGVQASCVSYFLKKISDVGTEMKQP